MYYRYFLFAAVLLLPACHSANNTGKQVRAAEDAAWTPPPAGTVVAADSMKTDDKLNDFYFAVKLTSSHENNKADSRHYGFVYDLDAHFGPNDAMSIITMPRGGRNLQPLLQKSPDEPFGYIIGFAPGKSMGGDGSFLPYYLVRAVKNGANIAIEIKGLRSYSFEAR